MQDLIDNLLVLPEMSDPFRPKPADVVQKATDEQDAAELAKMNDYFKRRDGSWRFMNQYLLYAAKDTKDFFFKHTPKRDILNPIPNNLKKIATIIKDIADASDYNTKDAWHSRVGISRGRILFANEWLGKYILGNWDNRDGENETVKMIQDVLAKNGVPNTYRQNPEAIEEAIDTKRLGKCYELSGKYVMDHPGWVLVHGSIFNPKYNTKPNPHAWAEKTEQIGQYPIRMVHDPVMQADWPWDAYERMMGAKVDNTYTKAQMAKQVLKAKHWGPWEPVTEGWKEKVLAAGMAGVMATSPMTPAIAKPDVAPVEQAQQQVIDTSIAIIHHTASHDVSASEIDRWHKEKGWDGIGYNFVIRADGTVEDGRPLTKQGAHAKGRNKYLGISLTGYDSFTDAQKASLKELLKKYGVKEIQNHHNDCPGSGLDLNTVATELGITYKQA